MFERIKTIFTTLKYAWRFSDTIASFLRHITGYPGMDDSARLRIWLRPVIIDLSMLTTLTQNTIDDAVARTAIRIIDSDRSWDAVYSLLMLAHDNTGIGCQDTDGGNAEQRRRNVLQRHRRHAGRKPRRHHRGHRADHSTDSALQKVVLSSEETDVRR